MLKFDPLRIRCSAIGNIMTNARSKTETLSKGTKKYIQELALENIYGIRKDFTSKYTDKGNLVENEGIQLAAELMDKGFLIKNEERYRNDYLSGIPDVNTDSCLLDIKSSFDATTYPWFEKEIPNKSYYYQLQGYMELTGKKTAYLCYCLLNTPFHMVEDEVRRAHYNAFLIDENEELRADVEKKHIVDHIPKIKRLKVYEVHYDEETIKKIYNRIDECREYYEECVKEISVPENDMAYIDGSQNIRHE